MRFYRLLDKIPCHFAICHLDIFSCRRCWHSGELNTITANYLVKFSTICDAVFHNNISCCFLETYAVLRTVFVSLYVWVWGITARLCAVLSYRVNCHRNKYAFRIKTYIFFYIISTQQINKTLFNSRTLLLVNKFISLTLGISIIHIRSNFIQFKLSCILLLHFRTDTKKS